MIGELSVLITNTQGEVVLILLDNKMLYFTVNLDFLLWVKDLSVLTKSSSHVLNSDPFYMCKHDCKPTFEYLYKTINVDIHTCPVFSENLYDIFRHSFFVIFSADSQYYF